MQYDKRRGCLTIFIWEFYCAADASDQLTIRNMTPCRALMHFHVQFKLVDYHCSTWAPILIVHKLWLTD